MTPAEKQARETQRELLIAHAEVALEKALRLDRAWARIGVPRSAYRDGQVYIARRPVACRLLRMVPRETKRGIAVTVLVEVETTALRNHLEAVNADP